MSELIEVVGVTSNDNYYESILSYRFIPKNEIVNTEFDYLICAVNGNNMRIIRDEAINMGIDENSLIPLRAMLLHGFDFDKYERIKKNVPTIIAPHC